MPRKRKSRLSLGQKYKRRKKHLTPTANWNLDFETAIEESISEEQSTNTLVDSVRDTYTNHTFESNGIFEDNENNISYNTKEESIINENHEVAKIKTGPETKNINRKQETIDSKENSETTNRKDQNNGKTVKVENNNDITTDIINNDADVLSQQEIQIITTAMSKVNRTGLKENILMFFKLVASNAFPLDNIAFHLFIDVINWYSLKTTTQMRYSRNSKEFWWTGEKLFGAKFIRFMEGYKHKGTMIEGSQRRGLFDPTDTSINFAVPGLDTLAKFVPSECLDMYRNEIPPGVIKPLLNVYGKTKKTESHILTFDGKKIVPNSADIDLLDCDDLNSTTSKLIQEEDIESINKVIDTLQKCSHDLSSLTPTEKENLQENLKSVLHPVAVRMKECREMCSKKKSVLERLKEKSMKSILPAKSTYLMNSLQTSIFQCNFKLKEALSQINCLCQQIVYLSSSREACFSKDDIIDMNHCSNFLELQEPSKARQLLGLSDTAALPLQYTKQRSKEWFERRHKVKVTGSTAHRACGLETLKAHKEVFDAVIGNKEHEEPSEQQASAMQYGKDNEINAVATICSKIVPILFPDLMFYEEGAYSIRQEDKEIVIVSPDGSLRRPGKTRSAVLDADPVVSIEIKCPTGSNNRSTPVHYKVPHYYICQSLLEQYVLKSQKHLFVSWSTESTTVIEVPYDETIVVRLLNEIKSVYYTDAPKRPTRLSAEAKDLQRMVKEHADKCKFLGEFPSVKIKNESFRGQAVPNSPFKSGLQEESTDNVVVTSDNLIKVLLRLKDLIGEMFELYNKKASEVIVFSIADVNRVWSREISHGMPIGYVFRGYSLNSDVMRRILETFLQECDNSGLHISCITFDGQWVKMKDEDSSGNPLTLFQLKRKFWKYVNSLSKEQMLEEFTKVWTTVKHIKNEPTSKASMIRKQQQVSAPIELYSDEKPLKLPGKLAFSDKESAAESNSLDTDTNEILNDLGNESNEIDIREIQEVLYTDESIDEKKVEKLTSEDIKAIQSILSNSKRKRGKQKFEKMTHDMTKVLMSSAENLKTLTDFELKEIISYLNNRLRVKNSAINTTKLNKIEKINALSRLSGDGSQLQPKPKETKSKLPSLQSLAKKIIKKTYPKQIIEAIYAIYFWQTERTSWINKSCVQCIVEVEQTSYSFTPTYIPTIGNNDGDAYLRVSCLDGHHLRTNIRAKICKDGTKELRKEAWRRVTESRNTPLVTAMIDVNQDGKIMDQQSDKLVRVMFCEEVENVMRKNNDETEATFCKLFREWHEAEDLPGLPAVERCKRALHLREWLLSGIDIDAFPPVGAFPKGIPRVTYEGLITSIEAHMYMYKLSKSGSFNWRSMSTLVAESFFGEIAEIEQHNNGVPSGQSFQRNFAAVSGLHCMRLNPERLFCMQTAKSRAYEIPKVESENDNEIFEQDVNDLKIATIIPRDHVFDRRKERGKKKLFTISKPTETPKGVQPIRQYYRVDESKMLMSSRLGVSFDE